MNLRLLQISDSALPIGGYTHSWGLEAALARALVSDAESLEQWTRSWLRHCLGPLEGVIVASVCRAGHQRDAQTVRHANELLDASLTSPSLRQASQEMGEQLLSLARTWSWSARGVADLCSRTDIPVRPERTGMSVPQHHATVFGVLGALAGGTAEETVGVFLHQAALAMIGAGVRAIPLGHTHGQQVLAYLHGDIEELAGLLAERELETAGSGCPFYEVLCDEQTRLYSRMFRS